MKGRCFIFGISSQPLQISIESPSSKMSKLYMAFQQRPASSVSSRPTSSTAPAPYPRLAEQSSVTALSPTSTLLRSNLNAHHRYQYIILLFQTLSSSIKQKQHTPLQAVFHNAERLHCTMFWASLRVRRIPDSKKDRRTRRLSSQSHPFRIEQQETNCCFAKEHFHFDIVDFADANDVSAKRGSSQR